ncbi:MAG TPA: sulfotransferase [Candidatus Sulfotelmatobacter sp.]
MTKPNLFIVGAPRCGTRSLYTYLKGHPDIFMPAQKELFFFDSDLREKKLTMEEYLGNFSEVIDQKIIGEATASYLRSRCAAQGIKAFNPTAQIIVMFRNPVDVMHSLHSLALHGTEPITDLAAALEADAVRTGREKIGYREFTDFPEQLQRYFDHFGRENVHVIIYDDIKADAANVGRNTLRFLGVREEPNLKFSRENSNRKVHIPQVERLLCHPPPSLLRLSALIPQKTRWRISGRLSRLNSDIRPREPLDPRLRKSLQAETAPKVDQLSRMLDRDLSGWYKE